MSKTIRVPDEAHRLATQLKARRRQNIGTVVAVALEELAARQAYRDEIAELRHQEPSATQEHQS